MIKISQEHCPPKGEPLGGYANFWKDYADCQGYHSITCQRPDCKRCATGRREGTVHFYIQLIGAVRYLSEGRKIPKEIQELLDHLDATKNAHARPYKPELIEAFIQELKESEKNV